MKIPVIINNRNLLTWTKSMIEKIKTYDNVGEIIIIDNGSTYEPLIEWYNTKPCEIIYCDNIGHLAPWNSGVVKSLGCKNYVVSDSDLGLDYTPKNTLTYLLDKMNKLKLNKIGLGLNSDLVLEHHPYYNHIQSYEKTRNHNSNIIDDILIDVAIDTTFALYDEDYYFIGGGSTMMPYVADHYPWYFTKNDVQNNVEFKFYIDNANESSSCKLFLL